MRWLKEEYQDTEKIDSMECLKEKPTTKEYLKKIHAKDRYGHQLAENPSIKDLSSLQKAYGKAGIHVMFVVPSLYTYIV